MTEWGTADEARVDDTLVAATDAGDDFDLELVEAEVVALELPVWEPTGEGRVDAALDRLHDVVNLPTSEHVEVYEDVHRRLSEALSDLESTS